MSQRQRAGNVPAELTSFVGRSRELAEVKRLLAAGRVVTLTGPGGIGKSRLALRVAHMLGRHFPDGVWLTELAGLDGPDLVPNALARSLGVYDRPEGSIQDTLVAHLRDRRVLLVLDNCEHLLEACHELVMALVSACDGVRVLCTSRERLGVAGEATVVLSALELPTIDAPGLLAGLAEVEALRLLADRAVAVAPDFALTEDNCGAAGDICRRLDGLPLAIELAAVRLASMTPGDLLERLDDRFRLLAAGRQARPGRSQTLRAAVDWSHDLLGPGERILWRRLSVFAGGFGLTAAEAVCAGEGLEREQIAGLIGRLVDASILTMAQGGRRGRYRMLETVALVRLRRGETELAQELLAAFRETVQRVDDAFGHVLGLYLCATAMAAAGRRADARRLALEGLAASDRAGDAFSRGLLDVVLGTVEWLAGDRQAAEARVKEAVRILDRIGHRWGLATSLEALAWVAGSSGRPGRAALLLGASAALWDELGSQLLPQWRDHHDGCDAAARAALGEGRHRARWEEGYALGRDQAVAAALDDKATVPAARPAPVTAADGAFELSARELEVARLVADGLSNPAIAAALFVSVATVKTHVSHILAKLGLDSRTQLARWVAGHDPGPPAPAATPTPRPSA